MSTRFRLSTSFIQRLSELGLSHEAVLRNAGLPQNTLEQERVLLTTEELFAFHRGIDRTSGDAAIGLQLGTEVRVERYDPIGIAALYASSFQDALQRLARYKRLSCPEEIHVTERGKEVQVRFEWLLTEDDEPTVLTDVCFAYVFEIARRGTAGAVRPSRVAFKRKAQDAAVYERHFGCPIEFGARANVIAFDRSDLERPFVTHNADILSMVAPQLDAELAQQLAGRSTRERVKGSIKKTLAGRRPELRLVAREMGVSARTLQRRLTDESVTFQQLLAEARRELARHYLQHSTLELGEIAYLLGYEDANSFFRAFQQWEGTSPGERRAELGARIEASRVASDPATVVF